MPENAEVSMSVLMLAEDFYPKKSGGAFIDWHVAKYLTDCGDDVTVVTPNYGSLPNKEKVENVEILRPYAGVPENIPPNSKQGQFHRVTFGLVVLPYLMLLLRRRDFDLIYSTNHLYHPIATILKTLFQLPLISFVGYSPSIYEDSTLADSLVLLERLNFRFFMGDRVLCRTPKIRDLLEQKTNAAVTRQDGIVDTSAVKSAIGTIENIEMGIDTTGVRLIFVGRFTEHKQPHRLPFLLAELPYEYSLLLIGDGPKRDAVEMNIRKSGVSDRVEMVGRLSHERTLQAIYTSDILVLPSRADAYPAVVFEALSLGTQVVGTPVGVLTDIDHPHLTVVPFEEFQKAISQLKTMTSPDIDDQFLQQYSVNRFAKDVRQQMKLL